MKKERLIIFATEIKEKRLEKSQDTTEKLTGNTKVFLTDLLDILYQNDTLLTSLCHC
ncbi:hypothetical protein GCM10007084_04220 [Parabacteroides faecis]|nr:hypothetical protein GCM10007084_04220 [Parabacteroides faecis]